MPRLITSVLLALILILPQSSQAAGTVTVTLSCKTEPEVTTVKNGTAKAITITSIASTYQPRKGREPYTMQRQLAAGASITFHTGPKATAIVLDTQLIYNNKPAKGQTEGVKVLTSGGNALRNC